MACCLQRLCYIAKGFKSWDRNKLNGTVLQVNWFWSMSVAFQCLEPLQGYIFVLIQLDCVTMYAFSRYSKDGFKLQVAPKSLYVICWRQIDSNIGEGWASERQERNGLAIRTRCSKRASLYTQFKEMLTTGTCLNLISAEQAVKHDLAGQSNNVMTTRGTKQHRKSTPFKTTKSCVLTHFIPLSWRNSTTT